MAHELLEREVELGELRDLLDAAEDHRGGVGILEGEAGIGKTALLSAAGEIAAGRGFLVLRARGGELERGFAFGVVRQLFEPMLRRLSAGERAEVFGGAAGLAAPVLAAEEIRGTGAADAMFAAQHGLYWLVDNLAARRPVLLIVDDAHWADVASLRWLDYLARRLDGVAAALLTAWRAAEPGADVVLLESLRAEPAVRTLPVGPLSGAATAAFVAAVLGPDPSERFCAACHRASGGNPFLLGELLAAVAEAGVPPTAEGAERVPALGPATVSRSVLLRLARLPPEATALAEAAAVLDRGAGLAQAAATVGLEPAEALPAAAQLQEARLFAADEPLRFAHPILRAAVYESVPRVRRGDLHRRAARVLGCDESTIDEAATHLLSAPPAADPWAVTCLREAAKRAQARGAPDVAVALLERAASEPPPPADRAAVLLALGRAERLDGRATAVRHLRAALALAGNGAMREGVVRELSTALFFGGFAEEAVDALAAEIARVPAEERERALRLEADLFVTAYNTDRYAPTLAARATAVGPLEGATPAERALLAMHAAHRWIRGDAPASEVVPPMKAAWGDGDLLTDVGGEERAVVGWPILLFGVLDQLGTARAIAVQALALAQTEGSVLGITSAHRYRGYVAFLEGALVAAQSDLHIALAATEASRWTPVVRHAVSLLVRILCERGDLAAADRALGAHGLADVDPPRTLSGATLLRARAGLRLLQGRTAEARADAEGHLRRMSARSSPGLAFGSRLIAAEACLRDGDRDGAVRFVDEELGAARRLGPASALGSALAAKGRLTGDETGLTQLREAVRLLEGTPRTLLLAGALVDLGSALRRARRPVEAREPLRRGLDLAQRCGAKPLVERGRVELLAAGARARRRAFTGVDALTPAERRVADMAVTGMSNPQIAQALFVTRKTVEAHLAAAYRKLGISSRGELEAALA
jgi:DNA-binding CsgD family transcriptional regulator